MTTNKRIIVVLVFISLLFLLLLGYLTWFVLFRSEEVAANPYNKRNQAEEANILRGSIFDRNGVVLARSQESGARSYPYGSLYSGVIGYNSSIYGKSQLEKSYNDTLLAKGNILGIQPSEGHSIYLTIDHGVQQSAQGALNGRIGAAVAINPQTGEILALASYPNFDPNEEVLKVKWKELNDNTNSPFLPRATQGLYTPGSTFKVITAAAIIKSEELGVRSEELIKDEGSIKIDGKVFSNYKGVKHGEVDLKKAFTVSSNVAFCLWGSEIGGDRIRSMASSFGFMDAISIGVAVSSSRFPQKEMSKADVAAASIGQWEMMATPLEMARVAGIVANGGKDIPLRLVGKVVNKDGVVLEQDNRVARAQIVESTIIRELQDYMREVVRTGTATNAKIAGVEVAGKTGTAENSVKDREHAWFIGYAPADNPTIAVAVVLEQSGRTGSEVAVPVAREIIKGYLGR